MGLSHDSRPWAEAILPALARILSGAANGIEAFPVAVEDSQGSGDSMIVIIGLPEAPTDGPKSEYQTSLWPREAG